MQVTMYAEDPLVYHEKFKAKWAVAFLDSVKQVRPRIQEITLPLFIMHGTEDHLVIPAASQFVYDNINSPRVPARGFTAHVYI